MISIQLIKGIYFKKLLLMKLNIYVYTYIQFLCYNMCHIMFTCDFNVVIVHVIFDVIIIMLFCFILCYMYNKIIFLLNYVLVNEQQKEICMTQVSH